MSSIGAITLSSQQDINRKTGQLSGLSVNIGPVDRADADLPFK